MTYQFDETKIEKSLELEQIWGSTNSYVFKVELFIKTYKFYFWGKIKLEYYIWNNFLNKN
jgi:hypothetical protein